MFLKNSAVFPVFQQWNSNGWISEIGNGASSSIEITVQPDNTPYLYVDLYRNSVDDGAAMICTSLETSEIEAGTAAGEVTPFWFQFDYRVEGGDGNANVFVGLFNEDGDNDQSPALNWAGCILSGSSAIGRVYNDSGFSSAATMTGASSGSLHRFKMYVYNENGKTLANLDLYTVDKVTFEETKIGSVDGFVLLDSGETFEQGLDVIGVRNTCFMAGPHAQYSIDNIYFSTEHSNREAPSPSFADLSVNGVLGSGSADFDPWNTNRWANWYSDGKLIRPFTIDCDVTMASGYDYSNPWAPDVSMLATNYDYLIYMGDCSRGITFNGNGTFIDLRIAKPSLGELYSNYRAYPSADRHALTEGILCKVARKSLIGPTEIKNIWIKGCTHGIRTWSSTSQSHPLILNNCDMRRNQWGIYLNGTATTVTNCSIMQSALGGMYLGNGSHDNTIVDNVWQDNNYQQDAHFSDICIDSTYGNILSGNDHWAPLAGTYHTAAKLFRNKGDGTLRENGACFNVIANNTVDGYSVAYEVGARMGMDVRYDLTDEGREYAQYNLLENNEISNTEFGIKVNTSGNIINGNIFSNVTHEILLHNVFYSLIETTIMNQTNTQVSYWFKNSDYTANSTYAEWFTYLDDRNIDIDVSNRFTHICSDGSADFDTYSGDATLLINDSLIVNTSTMNDVYASGGTPIDAAVGDFWEDLPGDEIAVIWDTPVSKVDGTNYYTILIYDSNGIEVNRSGKSTVRWGAIAAGDFTPGPGDEIAAVHSSDVDGMYPIYIFQRGHKDPAVTLLTNNTEKIWELAGGNFNTAGDGYDEVAAIYSGGATSVFYRKPTDTTWSSTTTETADLRDIAAGNFDGDAGNGDEIAGINTYSSLVRFYRPGTTNYYASGYIGGTRRWSAIAGGDFDGDSGADEVAVSSSLEDSGLYKIYCLSQGATQADQVIDQNVLGVSAIALDGGTFPVDSALRKYERVQGFSSSNYESTMSDWGESVVVLPSAPQTHAIPAFLLNTDPDDNSKQYLKVTPIVR
ncbi:right-handed parallel beta-helix repeat-containing protein [Tichowtungia aerotolerans]|uniref:Right handed beta helix domain-containing protein n=1 Tax=Tichowtungia aerotolerans TaxID=2697043 RepID=A0A6P1M8R0_9BACT|nr:hypothetical protein [Tichowtungia aerotolerans]QHI68914.1 hypothetical protein GT409_05445 [Tichowtungia aerotolerans]